MNHDSRPDRKTVVILDRYSVLMNTYGVSISPKAIQDLLDELETSKQSPVTRLECLAAAPLGSFRDGERCHPVPTQKTFEAEGEILEHALTKSLHLRNEAIKNLCSSVRRFRDATIKEGCKLDYPHALQALWKALDRAKDLIQS